MRRSTTCHSTIDQPGASFRLNDTRGGRKRGWNMNTIREGRPWTDRSAKGGESPSYTVFATMATGLNRAYTISVSPLWSLHAPHRHSPRETRSFRVPRFPKLCPGERERFSKENLPIGKFARWGDLVTVRYGSLVGSRSYFFFFSGDFLLFVEDSTCDHLCSCTRCLSKVSGSVWLAR